jgi:tRNA-2-methylthio-N6-dimethylallyladenosine synthase
VSGSYHIETWGCQMNVLDSAKLAGTLELQGYRRAASAAEADVILLNTCSIREKAAEKVFCELGRLKPLKKRKRGLLLGVSGCVAQQEGEQIFARASHVDFVLGPRAGATLAEILLRHRSGDESVRGIVDVEYRSDSVDFPHEKIRRVDIDSGRALVTIIEGCNHRCTYCVVPHTRGREICREMGQVLNEVRGLARQGILEVEFLGQTVNAYRDSEGHGLGDLLVETARVEGIERIRFTTSHPAQMTESLMDAMAEAGHKVCPYLHLPVQSGSSSVLRAMRRGYDRESFLSKIAGLRRRIPGISFGTDVIVGFPSETERDFLETLTLLREVGFDTVYSFSYSPRPGTAAAELPVSPPELGLERLRRLQAEQKELQNARNQRWVGRTLTVLVEGRSKRDPSRWSGRSPEHRIVNFDGPAASGRLCDVIITGASAFSLRGERVLR